MVPLVLGRSQGSILVVGVAGTHGLGQGSLGSLLRFGRSLFANATLQFLVVLQSGLSDLGRDIILLSLLILLSGVRVVGYGWESTGEQGPKHLLVAYSRPLYSNCASPRALVPAQRNLGTRHSIDYVFCCYYWSEDTESLKESC